MTHLLDTSAVLAHYLDEPGAQEVSALLEAGPDKVALAAPSWPELARRIKELIDDPSEREKVFRSYTRDLCSCVVFDEAAARAAVSIQDVSPARLPLVDALIAGCAASAELILVHRDRHFDSVPGTLLQTVRLPTKVRS